MVNVHLEVGLGAVGAKAELGRRRAVASVAIVSNSTESIFES